ncbi:uncharacterized protein VTP21DRAFT_7140 [Calcarisporiella thermophila]|uniref:uncharacterized protein n=1 Tax=Calcarisporiella thermophila TaxID=911321 RepID=UPI0037439C7E
MRLHTVNRFGLLLSTTLVTFLLDAPLLLAQQEVQQLGPAPDVGAPPAAASSVTDPGPRRGHCLVNYDKNIYLFGGQMDGARPLFVSASIPISNNSNIAWQSVPSNGANNVVDGACVVTPDGYLVITGSNGNPKGTGVQYYNFKTKKWNSITHYDLPKDKNENSVFANRRQHVAAYFGDKTILFFGGVVDGKPTQDTYLLTQTPSENGWWYKVVEKTEFTPPPLTNASMVGLDDVALLFGSQLQPAGQWKNIAYQFSVKDQKWLDKVIPLPTGFDGLRALKASNKEIWLVREAKGDGPSVYSLNVDKLVAIPTNTTSVIIPPGTGATIVGNNQLVTYGDTSRAGQSPLKAFSLNDGKLLQNVDPTRPIPAPELNVASIPSPSNLAIPTNAASAPTSPPQNGVPANSGTNSVKDNANNLPLSPTATSAGGGGWKDMIPIIAGGAVGGIALAGLVILLAVYVVRKHNQNSRPPKSGTGRGSAAAPPHIANTNGDYTVAAQQLAAQSQMDEATWYAILSRLFRPQSFRRSTSQAKSIGGLKGVSEMNSVSRAYDDEERSGIVAVATSEALEDNEDDMIESRRTRASSGIMASGDRQMTSANGRFQEVFQGPSH